jgi:hypothetical protein
LIAMPTIFLLPESPRWLVKKGRDSEAHAIMELLHEDPETVESEMTAIRISLSMSGEASSIGSIFRMGEQRVFHRAALGCLAQMMLQMTGYGFRTSVTCLANTKQCQQYHILRIESFRSPARL